MTEETFNYHMENRGKEIINAITKKEEERMTNKRINILAEGEWILPAGTKYRNVESLDSIEDLCDQVIITINSELKNKGGYMLEVDFSEVEPLYPTKGMFVPEEGIEFADGRYKLIDVGINGFTYSDSTSNRYMYHKFGKIKSPCYELKRTLPKTINVCECCFKEVCECVRQPSTEPWTDRLKISNWCFKQEELVLISHRKAEAVPWTFKSFSTDYVHMYRWSKINPETNELMYKENKVFCDKECL